MPDRVQRRVEKTEVGDVTIPTPGDVIEAVCRATQKWLNYEPGHILRLVVTSIDLAPGARCRIITNSDCIHHLHDFLLNRQTGLWLLDNRGSGAPHFTITIVDHLGRYEVPRPEPDGSFDAGDDETGDVW